MCFVEKIKVETVGNDENKSECLEDIDGAIEYARGLLKEGYSLEINWVLIPVGKMRKKLDAFVDEMSKWGKA